MNSGFQYLKGAIGRLPNAAPCGLGIHFNTSKVRLEGGDGTLVQEEQDTFQYLKGAIGSIIEALDVLSAAIFQYLKGAIGRRRRAGLAGPWLDFNTSKVRLEVARPTSSRASISRLDFNTSKVRLEVAIGVLGDRKLGAFQYLKGAIGSRRGRSVLSGPRRFQYLKGAIGSQSWGCRPRGWGRISIPQRCDWKPVVAASKRR